MNVNFESANSPEQLLKLCRQFRNERAQKFNHINVLKSKPIYEKICAFNDYQTSKEFKYSEGDVYLHAYLPNGKNFEISVGIRFKKYDIDDFTVTFGNEETITQLFKGINTPIELCKRGFIKFSDGTNFCIVLNNVHITVDKLIASELANGIDFMFEKYIECIALCEQRYGVTNSYYHKSYGFRLAKIPYELWNIMQEYILDNICCSLDKNENKIFQYSKYALHIYTENHTEYSSGTHAILRLLRSDDEIGENNYWLCWNFIEEFPESDEFSVEGIWSYQFTKDWFFNDFMGKVINNLRKRRRKHKFYNINNLYRIDEIKYINTDATSSIIDFADLLRMLCAYYCISDDIYTEYGEIQKMFVVLQSIVIKCTMMNACDIEYISGKLFERTDNYSTLVSELTKIVKIETVEKIESSYYIYLIVDAILLCIERYPILLYSQEIINYMKLLNKPIERYNIKVLLDKAKEY